MLPLKYLNNFWKTVEMSLINCEINLMLIWSRKLLLIAGTVANKKPTFAVIANTKTIISDGKKLSGLGHLLDMEKMPERCIN